jgi:hypothetical protein
VVSFCNNQTRLFFARFLRSQRTERQTTDDENMVVVQHAVQLCDTVRRRTRATSEQTQKRPA